MPRPATENDLTLLPFADVIRDLGERTPDGRTSPKGAKGVMQVLDSTNRDPGFGVRPAADDSLEERTRVGRDYAEALERHYGSRVLASAAYNAGPGRVNEWLRTIGDPRTGAIGEAAWASRLPFGETRNYVARTNRLPIQGVPPEQNGASDLGGGWSTFALGGRASLPVPPEPPPGGYGNWYDAALGGNLASYAWTNRPGMNDLVPGWSPNSSLVQRGLDYASVPGRLLMNALLAPVQQADRARTALANDPSLGLGRVPEEALHNATLAIGGAALNGLAVPYQPIGNLGVFAGPLARTANVPALNVAKRGLTASENVELNRLWKQFDNAPDSFPAPNTPIGARFDELRHRSEDAKRNTSPFPMDNIGNSLALANPGNVSAWNRTGWFRDVDGNWKFEIPDQGAGFKLKALPGGWDGGFNLSVTGPMRLEDMLHHPGGLFQAYPDFADIMVHPLRSDAGSGTHGLVDPATGNIELAPTRDPSKALSTLLHEIQHRIQSREGFAYGGNPDEWLPPGFNEIYAPVNAEYQALKRQTKAAGVNYDQLEQALNRFDRGKPTQDDLNLVFDLQDRYGRDFVNTYKDVWKTYYPLFKTRQEAVKKYLSLAGETEARNVQARLETRAGRETAPWTTRDYPVEPQVVRFAGEGTLRLVPVEHDPFQTKTGDSPR